MNSEVTVRLVIQEKMALSSSGLVVLFGSSLRTHLLNNREG